MINKVMFNVADSTEWDNSVAPEFRSLVVSSWGDHIGAIESTHVNSPGIAMPDLRDTAIRDLVALAEENPFQNYEIDPEPGADKCQHPTLPGAECKGCERGKSHALIKTQY